eukprot:TRINITY_DN32468_c0_g1_i2.p1 TRINITY_DN32468_c0_g1~~TRINITY_DN32468_c0_g1_i2.p1  ORF type:complete len:588 (+),score=192.53 TRINITY_DN32468_c0_g1_i2:144-1907(+)
MDGASGVEQRRRSREEAAAARREHDAELRAIRERLESKDHMLRMEALSTRGLSRGITREMRANQHLQETTNEESKAVGRLQNEVQSLRKILSAEASAFRSVQRQEVSEAQKAREARALLEGKGVLPLSIDDDEGTFEVVGAPPTERSKEAKLQKLLQGTREELEEQQKEMSEAETSSMLEMAQESAEVWSLRAELAVATPGMQSDQIAVIAKLESVEALQEKALRDVRLELQTSQAHAQKATDAEVVAMMEAEAAKAALEHYSLGESASPETVPPGGYAHATVPPPLPVASSVVSPVLQQRLSGPDDLDSLDFAGLESQLYSLSTAVAEMQSERLQRSTAEQVAGALRLAVRAMRAELPEAAMSDWRRRAEAEKEASARASERAQEELDTLKAEYAAYEESKRAVGAAAVERQAEEESPALPPAVEEPKRAVGAAAVERQAEEEAAAVKHHPTQPAPVSAEQQAAEDAAVKRHPTQPAPGSAEQQAAKDAAVTHHPTQPAPVSAEQQAAKDAAVKRHPTQPAPGSAEQQAAKDAAVKHHPTQPAPDSAEQQATKDAAFMRSLSQAPAARTADGSDGDEESDGELLEF